jgi:uncharacterized repeat protein (TIGR03803 family)
MGDVMTSYQINAVGKDQSMSSSICSTRLLRRTVIATFQAALTFALISALSIVVAQSAWAQTETVLYAFPGTKSGLEPQGGLVRDGKGNLYGTTAVGGTPGVGTLFEITAAGVETLLHNFKGRPRDGTDPSGNLILSGGKLYGTTEAGGTESGNCNDENAGCGTVFEFITSSGAQKVLYTFLGGSDGSLPSWAGLVRDTKGNLYGTTMWGGGSGCSGFGCGTVFKVTSNGTETVLYRFTGGVDGGLPEAGLVIDPQGNLYGTTSIGGSDGVGTVFEVTPTGTEKVLHSFTDSPKDGASPYAGLVRDASGNLYGTTFGGGPCCGTVFEVTSSGKEKTLYNFAGGSDGSSPWAGLVRDAKGNLYGTTYQGGGSGCKGPGCGTVFQITPAGKETVLYRFTGGTDGGLPMAGLIRDGHGNLYGTATSGGDPSCSANAACGVVFEVTP